MVATYNFESVYIDRHSNNSWQFGMFKRDKDKGHDNCQVCKCKLSTFPLCSVTYVVVTHWNCLIGNSNVYL